MYYVGIDVGGTSIKAGLVDGSGAVRELHRDATPIGDLNGFISTLVNCVTKFQANAPIRAIGVGAPGLRSYTTHVIETSPNIPCVHGVNLEKLLTDRVALPVITENDAKAGAYGEWVCGAGRGLQQMAYITIGTGL